MKLYDAAGEGDSKWVWKRCLPLGHRPQGAAPLLLLVGGGVVHQWDFSFSSYGGKYVQVRNLLWSQPHFSEENKKFAARFPVLVSTYDPSNYDTNRHKSRLIKDVTDFTDTPTAKM